MEFLRFLADEYLVERSAVLADTTSLRCAKDDTDVRYLAFQTITLLVTEYSEEERVCGLSLSFGKCSVLLWAGARDERDRCRTLY